MLGIITPILQRNQLSGIARPLTRAVRLQSLPASPSPCRGRSGARCSEAAVPLLRVCEPGLGDPLAECLEGLNEAHRTGCVERRGGKTITSFLPLWGFSTLSQAVC